MKKLQNANYGIYPVTLMKWHLSKNFMRRFLKTGESKEKIIVTENKKDCLYCKPDCECKFHKSFDTVCKAVTDGVSKLDDSIYVTRNEIFSFYDDILRIVYCPHFSQIRTPLQKLCKRSILYVQLIEIKLKDDSEFIASMNDLKVTNEIDTDELVPFRCWFAGDLSIIATDQRGNFNLICDK